MQFQRVSAPQLREWLHDGNEIAVLDVSDGGPYSRAHILAASSMPLANIEIQAPLLLPNRTVRIVLCDENELMAVSAAEILTASGFSNVYVLEGGNSAWQKSGFPLFSGNGIISKAFGEQVEECFETPHVSPEDLQRWKEADKPFIHIDARPLAEYKLVSIPGAIDCPGAEIVYRVPEIIDSDNTPIVVNCAGRTRSIIGAQSLRNAGIRNPVYALKNGTMGWHLAGLQTESGANQMLGVPSERGLKISQAIAEGLANQFQIREISRENLQEFLLDLSRTTYVFDVRQPDEYVKGHLPGSINAPGGQLVQATDTFAAVRNSRMVLVDEFRVQAVMTAHWLKQMGWSEVSILQIEQTDMTEIGQGSCAPLMSSDVPGVEVAELQSLIEGKSVAVIDVGESYWYRQARIPGSFYSMRSQLQKSIAHFDRSQLIAVCDGDGRISRFAAKDLLRMGFKNVRYVAGGRNAWRNAGFLMERIGENTDDRVLSETDDMWYPPWARKSGVEEAMMQYLTWEIDLMKTVSQETYVKFCLGKN